RRTDWQSVLRNSDSLFGFGYQTIRDTLKTRNARPAKRVKEGLQPSPPPCLPETDTSFLSVGKLRHGLNGSCDSGGPPGRAGRRNRPASAHLPIPPRLPPFRN